MFKSAWQFDTEALDLADKRVIASPKLMARALKRQESRLKRRILKIVKVEPPPPKPGITKKMTPRQRRAFWATNGFGHGIPYVRTHALVNAWDARFEFEETGGGFVVENTSPAATFVIGDRQQVFHADTGWINAERTVDEFVPIVLTAYEETWLTVSDPFAGVK